MNDWDNGWKGKMRTGEVCVAKILMDGPFYAPPHVKSMLNICYHINITNQHLRSVFSDPRGLQKGAKRSQTEPSEGCQKGARRSQKEPSEHQLPSVFADSSFFIALHFANKNANKSMFTLGVLRQKECLDVFRKEPSLHNTFFKILKIHRFYKQNLSRWPPFRIST